MINLSFSKLFVHTFKTLDVMYWLSLALGDLLV